MSTMQAVFATAYGGPQVLQVQSVAVPQVKAHEVLIQVHASGITRADSMMRSGTPRFARLFLGLSKPKKPIIGTGFAGTISQVGSAVKNFAVGDQVFGETTINFGANAEYVAVDARGIVMKLPPNMSYEAGSLMCDGPLTSWNFLHRMAKVQPGDRVLIIGAGGALGTAAVQIAKYLGAVVTGVCSTSKVEKVASLGADAVIDYTQRDFTQEAAQYEVIFDTVAASSFSQCKPVLSVHGQYLCPDVSLSLLWQGLSSGKGKQAKFGATGLLAEDKLKQMLLELLKMYADGMLAIPIEREYALQEIQEAHARLETGRKWGNLVLVLNNH